MVSGAEKHDRWVQCDKCDKWRRLPGCTDTEYAALMANPRWQCNKNRWDQARASCAAPEEEDTCDSSIDGLPSSQLPTPASEPAFPLEALSHLHVRDVRPDALGTTGPFVSPAFSEEKALGGSAAAAGWSRRGASAAPRGGGSRGEKGSRGGRRQNSLNSDAFAALGLQEDEEPVGFASHQGAFQTLLRAQETNFQLDAEEEDSLARDSSPSRLSQTASSLEGLSTGKKRCPPSASQRGKKRKCEDAVEAGGRAETPAERGVALPHEDAAALWAPGHAGRAALLSSGLRGSGGSTAASGGASGQPAPTSSFPAVSSPSLSASGSGAHPSANPNAHAQTSSEPAAVGCASSPVAPALESLQSGHTASFRVEETAHALVQSLAAGGWIDRENLAQLLSALPEKAQGTPWARGSDLSSLLASTFAAPLRNAAATGDASEAKPLGPVSRGDEALSNSAALSLGSSTCGENWATGAPPTGGGRGSTLARTQEPLPVKTQLTPHLLPNQAPKEATELEMPQHAEAETKGLPETTSAAVDNWVQCEACKKWRRLPASVDPDRLPETWLCAMTFWDPFHDSCDAPEEDYRDTVPHSGQGALPADPAAPSGEREGAPALQERSRKASLSEETLAKLVQTAKPMSGLQGDLALGTRGGATEGLSPLRGEREGDGRRLFERVLAGGGALSSPKKFLGVGLQVPAGTPGAGGVSPFGPDRARDPTGLGEKFAPPTPGAGGRGRRARGDGRGRREKEEDGEGIKFRDETWDAKSLGSSHNLQRQGSSHDFAAFSSWMNFGAVAASPFSQLGGAAASDALADGAAVTVLRIPPAARESGHPLADRLLLYAADGTVASCLACELPFQTLQLRLLEAYRYETPSRPEASLDFSFVSGFSSAPATAAPGRRHRGESGDVSSFSREHSFSASREGVRASQSLNRASSSLSDNGLFPLSCLHLLSQLESPGREEDVFSDLFDKKGDGFGRSSVAGGVEAPGDRGQGALEGDSAYFTFLEKNAGNACAPKTASLGSSNEVCVSLDFAANVRWPGVEMLSSDSEEEDCCGGREAAGPARGEAGREREEEGRPRKAASGAASVSERREKAKKEREDARRLQCMLSSMRELMNLCPLLDGQVGCLPSSSEQGRRREDSREAHAETTETGGGDCGREGRDGSAAGRRELDSDRGSLPREEEFRLERREGKANREDWPEEEQRDTGRTRPFAVLELKDIISLVCMVPDANGENEEEEDTCRRERERKKRKKEPQEEEREEEEEKEEKEEKEEEEEEKEEEEEEKGEEKDEEKEGREKEEGRGARAEQIGRIGEEHKGEKEEKEQADGDRKRRGQTAEVVEVEVEEGEDAEQEGEEGREDPRQEAAETEKERGDVTEERGDVTEERGDVTEETAEKEGREGPSRAGCDEEEGQPNEGEREKEQKKAGEAGEKDFQSAGQEEEVREDAAETDRKVNSDRQAEEAQEERTGELESGEREEAAKETEETQKEAKETEKAEEAEAVGKEEFAREKQRNKPEEKLAKTEDEKEVARIEEETSKETEGKRKKAAEGDEVPGKKGEQEKEGGESSAPGDPEETPAAKETVFSALQEGDSVQGSAAGKPVTNERSRPVRGEAEKLEETEEEDVALPSSHNARKRKHSVLSSSSEDEKERGEAGEEDTETAKRAESSAEQSALVAQATLHVSAPAAAKTRSGGAKKRKKNKKKNKRKAPETPRSSRTTEEATETPASLESQIRNSSRPPAVVGSVRQQNPCPTASRDASSVSSTVPSVSPTGPLPSSSARLESAWKSDQQGVSADPTNDPTPGDSGRSASESNLANAENRCRLSDSRVEANCEEEERSLESNSEKKVEALRDEKAAALPSGEKNSSSLRSSEVSPEEHRFSRNTTSARGSASQSSSFVSTSSISSVCLSRSASPPAVSQAALKAEARTPPEDGSVSGLRSVSEPHSDCSRSFSLPSKELTWTNVAPAGGPAFSCSAEEKHVASEAAPSEVKDADPGGDSACVFRGGETAREESEKFGDEEDLEEGVRSGACRRLRDREENSGSLHLKGVEVEGGSRTCSNLRQRDSDVSETRSRLSRRESPRRDFSTVHKQRAEPGEPQRARGRSRSPSEPGLPPPSPMSSPPSPGPRDSSGFGDSPRSVPSSSGASALPSAVPGELASRPPARAGSFRPSAFAYSPHASLHSGPAPVGLHRPLLGHAPREGDGLLGPGRPVGSGGSGGPRPPFERSWEKRQGGGFFAPRRGAAPEPEGDEFSGSKCGRGFKGGDRDAERNGDRRDAGPRGPSGGAGGGRPSSPAGSGASGGKGAGGRLAVFTGDSGGSKEVELDSASGGSRRGSGASALSPAPVTVLAPPSGEPPARPVCPRILNLPPRLASGNFGRSAFCSRSGRGESAHFTEDDFKGCGAASGSPSSCEGRALLGLGPKARAPFGPDKREWGDRRPGYEGERGSDSQWGFSEAPTGPEHARHLPGFSSGGRFQFWSGGSFYAGGEDASVSSPSGASLPFGGSGGDFPARPSAPPVLLPPPGSSFNPKPGFSTYGPGGAQLAGDSDNGILRPVPRRSDSWGDEERGERRRGGGSSGADSFYQGEDGASSSFSSFHRNRETRDVYAGGDGTVLRPGAGGGAWHGGERRSSRELGGSGYRASHRRRED
ncbi:UNVERIFIED_CONTAM: CW-type Zinc Finger protein [Hammondia hammondi]|eukprot:XP_008886304.1 CW-type Zinc Finger protein [Hammondia hammondi]